MKRCLMGAPIRALVSLAMFGSAQVAPGLRPASAHGPTPAGAQPAASAQDSTAARPPAPATAGADTIPRTADSSLVANLRRGGYIIVFRHAATNWDEKDAAGEDFENRAAQRNLSGQGRADAAAIGKALATLAVPIDSVFASPMWRCRDTAELAFGRYEKMVELFRKGPVYRETRTRMLGTKPLEGKNRVLVGHQDPLIPIIPGLHRDQLKEGDALVIEPLGDRKYKVVSQVTPADWTRLAAAYPAPVKRPTAKAAE